MTVQAPIAPAASATPRRVVGAALPREGQRDRRRRNDAAQQPRHDDAVMRARPTRRAIQPAKLRPEKNSTSAHSSRGRMASSGPYGPGGSSGRMMHASAANRALARSAASSMRVDQRMQPGLLQQQHRRRGNHGAGQRDLARAGERAGGQHDDRRHLGGAVDVAPGSPPRTRPPRAPLRPPSSTTASGSRPLIESQPARPPRPPSSVNVRMPPKRACGPLA